MAITTHLLIYRGEDVVLPFDVDEDITAWTMEVHISDLLEDSTPLLSVNAVITDAAAGYCEATLTAAQTEGLADEIYYWELWRTNAGAQAKLATGDLTIGPRVAV